MTEMRTAGFPPEVVLCTMTVSLFVYSKSRLFVWLSLSIIALCLGILSTDTEMIGDQKHNKYLEREIHCFLVLIACRSIVFVSLISYNQPCLAQTVVR